MTYLLHRFCVAAHINCVGLDWSSVICC